MIINEKPREVDCPRCHEQCGWCSDYRHMHGRWVLPGSRRKCTIEAMHPDPVCEICGSVDGGDGKRRVIQSVTRSFQRLTSEGTEPAYQKPETESEQKALRSTDNG